MGQFINTGGNSKNEFNALQNQVNGLSDQIGKMPDSGVELKTASDLNNIVDTNGTMLVNMWNNTTSNAPPTSIVGGGDGIVFTYKVGTYGTQFAIARASTHIAARIYVGSWSEWTAVV